MMQIFSNPPKVICITQAWLNPAINTFIPGYEFIYFSSLKRAGGVVMYISKKFHYKVILYYDLDCKGCETI